jgi:isopenicillin N synthase-like dioxygenase
MIAGDSFVLTLGLRTTNPGKFVDDFEASIERYGCAVVHDHGVNLPLITEAAELFSQFSQEPLAYKSQFSLTADGGGYARRASGAESAQEVDSELWQALRSPAPGDHSATTAIENTSWPERPDGFRKTLSQLFPVLDHAGGAVLAAFAQFLWLEEDWFADPTKGHDGALQIIRFQPSPMWPDDTPFGFGPTVDVISMIFCGDEAHFEVRDRWEDRWIPVTLPRGAMMVMVGDMLQRLTTHILVSPAYRMQPSASKPSGHHQSIARFSLPFRPDFRIETLPECGRGTSIDLYPDSIAAGQYKLDRLARIRKDRHQ